MFNKPISEIETGFLQLICFYNNDTSNKTFVIDAYKELKRRNIKPLYSEIDIETIKKFEQRYIDLNTKYLNQESFTLVEFIWKSLFFYKELFWGNQLYEEQTKKKTQRLYIIITGVLLYSTFFIYVSITTNFENENYIEQIKEDIIQDSIDVAIQDWSGVYSFREPSKTWVLSIQKTDLKHDAVLEIKSDTGQTLINCSVVIKDFGIQVFPDTILSTLGINSYTDLFFELDVDKVDTVTWWHKFKPENFERINGVISFKKVL